MAVTYYLYHWNYSSPTEEGGTPKPRKMAIPDEVKARLGEPVTVEGLDPDQIKAKLKELYERYFFFGKMGK